MAEINDTAIWSVVTLLLRLGISPSLNGFQYSVRGICLGLQDDTRCLSVMNEIYPEIARHFRVSQSAVEHSMRSMLDTAWEKNPQCFQAEFGYAQPHRPTTGEFLVLAVYYLKRHRDFGS